MELTDIFVNKSHLPNNPLREDIIREVNKYTGYAYADDVHFHDYLTIDKNSMKVSHTRRHLNENREDNLAYYSMLSLLTQGNSTFTYEPNQLEIDAIILDFFPIDVLVNFPELSEIAIQNFIQERGLIDEATLSFPIDSFIPDVYNPSEIEVVDANYDEDEDWIFNDVQYIEVPVKKFIRRGKNDKIYVNKHKLLILAIDNYYGNTNS